MRSHILVILAAIAASTAHVFTKDYAHFTVKNDKSADLDWWKTAVFYQIYPRSFMDSDGDGIGDLQGIIQKLPYLQDLGVTATWLSPIFKSPQVDQGYDISDYRDIDPIFGTLDDLKELLEKAKALGIKLILDFVPNHTSDQHEWFKKSVANESGYEDFYVWHDGKIVDGVRQPPNNWVTEFGGIAWDFNEERQQYYYHAFAPQQPDLNYANPVVVQAMKDVLSYWLDFGVDGFRVDAVTFLFEDPEFRDEPLDQCNGTDLLPCQIYTKNLEPTYELIYEFRALLDNFTVTNEVDTRFMMTEAYSPVDKVMLYYGNEKTGVKGAHFPFNFLLLSLSKGFNGSDVIDLIVEWLSNISPASTSNWVLGNHDNSRVATRLGKENVDGLNMLTAILPGVMVTYNGEEIGMEDGEVTCEQGYDPKGIKDCSTFNETSRDFERTPFQWDNSTNAGFTTGTPWLPVSSKAQEVNVAAQNIEGVTSHYNIYKHLMELRKNFRGNSHRDDISLLSINKGKVLQIRRVTNDFEAVLIINTEDTQDVVKFVRASDKYIVLITDVNSSYQIGDEVQQLTLNPHESIILQGVAELTTTENLL